MSSWELSSQQKAYFLYLSLMYKVSHILSLDQTQNIYQTGWLARLVLLAGQ